MITIQTRITFTAPEVEMIHAHANAVWSYIAGDCLAGLRDMGSKRTYMTRAEVLDMVLDADRIEDSMRGFMRDWEPHRRDDFFARWNILDYKARIRLVTPAFPHLRYGM